MGSWDQVMFRSTWVKVRCLDFILGDMGSHWRVLSRGLTECDVLFKRDPSGRHMWSIRATSRCWF